ncbi:MAG: hypothetical protein WA865_17880 [Spirulinaceae cyanobacterium]
MEYFVDSGYKTQALDTIIEAELIQFELRRRMPLSKRVSFLLTIFC